MTTLKIIHLSVFLVFVGIMVLRYGWMDSISESYYKLGKKGWVFTVWIFVLGMVALNYGTGWMFLSGSALCIAGVAARFRDGFEREAHFMGAILAYVFGVIGIDILLIMAIVSGIGLLILFRVNRPVFWIEVWAFVMIVLFK